LEVVWSLGTPALSTFNPKVERVDVPPEIRDGVEGEAVQTRFSLRENPPTQTPQKNPNTQGKNSGGEPLFPQNSKKEYFNGSYRDSNAGPIFDVRMKIHERFQEIMTHLSQERLRVNPKRESYH